MGTHLGQCWILGGFTFLLLLTKGAFCVLPSPLIVTILSFNMEHELTWTPGPGTPDVARFRVQSYRNRKDTWVQVRGCADLDTSQSCDLTASFTNPYRDYLARVQAYTATEESNWTSSLLFHPLMDTVLGPPLVSVSGCGNCLQMYLTPPTSRGLYPPLNHSLFREFNVHVTRMRDMAQFSVELSSGVSVISYLEPGAEYCVTVVAVASFNSHTVPSEPHCAYTSPKAASTVPVFLRVLCAVCFLVALSFSALLYNSYVSSSHKHPPKTLSTGFIKRSAVAFVTPESLCISTIQSLESPDLDNDKTSIASVSSQDILSETHDSYDSYGEVMSVGEL